VDEEPSIRANTTVLLGNLAGQLSEVTCKKVLLNAFTRATKDAFPPSRVAGIKVRAGCLPPGRCEALKACH
jgi:SCY1-like protein 1